MSAIQTFFQETDLERSLLVGYYGGGNYGDELLLEVIANLMAPKQYRHVAVAYQNPATYSAYHHDFGHQLVDSGQPLQILRKLLTSRKIVIGGGGFWGMDVNAKIFGLGAMLFLSRYILRRKIYLVGVGYYASTNRLGHISAWLAGKAANTIIVRDNESAQQFGRIHPNVQQDSDIAWLASGINPADYAADIEQVERLLPLQGKALFITLRHFRGAQADIYHKQIGNFIESNQHQQIVVALLQPPETYPEGQRLLRSWKQLYPNVQTLDTAINPMGLFLYMQKHSHELALVAPQFHAIITAQINHIPFLPLVYDNKVSELLDQLKLTAKVPIASLQQTHLQQFADSFYEGSPTRA